MDLISLNEQQREAVLHMLGPIRVIAGAGSGKTRVLTNRLVKLMEEGVEPDRITACTFTKKAAKEIKERVIDSYGIDAENCKIGTLHSISYDILRRYRRHKSLAKVDIIRTGTMWLWFNNLFKKHKDIKNKDIKYYLGRISSDKLALRDIKVIEKEIEEKINSSALDYSNDYDLAYHFVYKSYCQYLKSNNYIDYSDMLCETYYALSNPENAEFTNKVINKIDHLLVDEFQDTNLVSYEIYKILGSKNNNIMVVGDPRQAIYSFQGSDWRFLDRFKNELNAGEVQLPTNYRSTQTIVNNSNTLIKYNKMTNIEDAQTPNEKGEDIRLLKSFNEMEEAYNVVDLVKEKIESGIDPNDIAILYRVNAQAYPFVDLFTMHELPFVLHSKDGFFKRREIKQIVNYAKAIINPEEIDVNDVKSIANAPVRYIKNTTLHDIDDNAGDYFYEEMKKSHSYIDYKQTRSITNLIDDIETGISMSFDDEFSTYDLISYILRDVGFLKYLQSEDGQNASLGGGGRDSDQMINLEVLLSFARKYPEPKQFLHFAEQMRAEDEKRSKDIDNKKGIHLMTMHSSKGLEYDHVIIVGACSRMMPYYRSRTEADYKEERRLAYVGVTRPKKKLYISTITEKFGRFNVKPSQYIEEMGLE